MVAGQEAITHLLFDEQLLGVLTALLSQAMFVVQALQVCGTRLTRRPLLLRKLRFAYRPTDRPHRQAKQSKQGCERNRACRQ
jgi:hypothetical protein